MKKMKKKLKFILPAVAIILIAALIFLSVKVWYPNYKLHGPLKITVDTESELNTFDGFGVSTCWWAQVCGGSEYAEEITKLLFSKDGLGLNILRYNIGGGEADNPNRTINNDWRASESFYFWDEASNSYKYDFTRDANAQKVLDLALSYGVVDTVVLFANSPHFSMTLSGKASGGDESNVSNLPKENYEAYADYFLTITQYFLDKGVPVKYISPVNEPQWGWGGGNASQEGCHYETEELYELYKIFAEKIQAKNMPVKLSAPESGAICEDTETWFKALYEDETVRKSLGTLSYHSYWSDDFVDRKINFGNWLKENTPDAKIEMSEWCQLPCTADTTSIFGALTEARVICNDIQYTGVDSWSVWTGVNENGIGDDGKNYSDGLLTAAKDFSEYDTAIRYYAVAHFSKFIPAGSVRLNTVKNLDDLRTWNSGNPEDLEVRNTYATNTVAFRTPDNKIVCVVVNEGESRPLKLNVDGVNTMSVYTTTGDEQMANTYNGKIKTVDMPAWSITTVVME